MIKSGIDQDALIDTFAQASARQTAQLRKAVSDATLRALQGREMTLKNIKGVLKSVTQAASTGAAQSALPPGQVESMLDQALAGMDDALVRAVEANRVALQRLADQGVDVQDKQIRKAMGDLQKLEDAMFDAVRKAAGGAGLESLAGPWAGALAKWEAAGSHSGAQAAATFEAMTQQVQSAMQQGRAAGFKAAQALAQSYTALVSGVLMGMTDAFGAAQAGAAPAADDAAATRGEAASDAPRARRSGRN